MRTKAIIATSLAATLMLAIACNKSVAPPPLTEAQVAMASLPLQLNYLCSNSPDYGDSIVYLQPSKADYIVHPVNAVALGKGTYFAWPLGLIIDSASGAINVSQSETGLRYIIGFVKTGTKDTCVKNLILAGVNYADSIYVIENNDMARVA